MTERVGARHRSKRSWPLALMVVVACGGNSSATTQPEPTVSTSPTTTTVPPPTTVPPVATTAPAPAEPIRTTFRQIADDSGPGVVEVSYPHLVHPDVAVAQRVNDQIDAVMQDLIDRFQDGVAADEPSETPSTLIVQAAPELLNEDLFSISGITADSFAGSGTGSTGRLGLIFALDDGSAVAAADLFIGGDLERLAEAAGEHLFADVLAGSPITAPDGLLPDPANFDAVWLTSTGIGVGFDQYQVAAAGAGNPAVLIPFAELQDVINATGILAPLQAGSTLPEL